jgi:hypothetical protein
MTTDDVNKLVSALEDWIDAKIRDDKRDPGESSCGGTGTYRYRDAVAELLISFLPPRGENP